MNHARLLEKYMRHVRQCEGADFTEQLNNLLLSEVVFGEEEVRTLKEISFEISKGMWEVVPYPYGE